MYVVYWEFGKYSAWNNTKEAQEQCQRLRKLGWRRVSYVWDDSMEANNGRYLVGQERP